MAPGFARLTGPVTLAGRVAPSRVMFGPHETNLGDGTAAISDRHVAYYERRAAGGAGAHRHRDGLGPPLRLALRAGPAGRRVRAGGWRRSPRRASRTARWCWPAWATPALQGSTAYSQSVLWGPSGVADAVTREMPMEMGAAEIDALAAGFAAAAGLAVAAGLDGVEIDAGARSLLRQFHSGPDQPPRRRLRARPAAG